MALDFESTLDGAIVSRFTIALTDSHHRITIEPWKQWLLTVRPWNAKVTMAALRLRKCPVFYIFALERAAESRNRVLENQLLVTVRGKEKERAVL